MYQSEIVINPATEQVAATFDIPTISSFKFQDHPVRIVMVNGVEFFLAKDLAPILGYGHAREAVRSRVDKRDRITVSSPDAIGQRGNPTALAVNESGLYALILGSRKPEAHAFKYWVTSEVLPTIRKTGRYELQPRVPALLGQITGMLRGRGAAKERQLNRIVAHRDGSFSFRIGKHWTRRVQPVDACALPLAHALREGLAVSALNVIRKIEPKLQLH
jgi:prophage antirepressor-like protein